MVSKKVLSVLKDTFSEEAAAKEPPVEVDQSKVPDTREGEEL